MATAAMPPPRPEDPVRHLVVPAVLTALLVALIAFAWLFGDSDLLWTAVFWAALMWGGVLLYFAGSSFARRRAPAA